MKGILPQEAK